MEYPDLYIRFLYHFNVDHDYYECHEVMEELWLEEGRDLLYQGLLQIAVGLYHHSNNNITGSIKLFEGGISKLADYPNETLGIDLRRIRNESIEYLQKLMDISQNPFEFYPLHIHIMDDHLTELVAKAKGES
jgi:predicted metal-dependent hydrolase